MSSIYDRLEALRKQLIEPEDRQEVAQWEKQVKRAMLSSDLKKHDGVKVLLGELKRKVAQINLLLQESRDLTDQDRRDLFTQRDCWEWFITLMDNSERKLQSIEERITDELTHLASEKYGDEE